MAFGSVLDWAERWNPLVELLVAVGTLAVVFIAYWEIRQNHREQHRRDVREVTERIYQPLLNPERSNLIVLDDVYVTYTPWSALESNALSAARMVPKRIRELARAMQQTGSEVTRDVTRVSRELAPIVDAVGMQLGGGRRGPGTRIRWHAGKTWGGDVSPLRVWLEGTTPHKWVQARAESWARDGIRLEVYDNEGVLGADENADRVFAAAFAFLDGSNDAKLLLAGWRRFHELSAELRMRIEEETRILANRRAIFRSS